MAHAASATGEQRNSAPPRVPPPRAPGEVDWHTLDKQRFLLSGVLLFGGASTLLYPLSVVKTRLQTIETGSLLSAVRRLVQQDGVRGLYKGWSVAILGTLPVRVAYLSVLESSKARLRACEAPPGWNVPPAVHTGAADFLAGAAASLVSQAVMVPVDVVSQRMMVQGGAGEAVHRNGWAVVRSILATDGIAGLYRGAGASVLIYSSSSGLWWGACTPSACVCTRSRRVAYARAAQLLRRLLRLLPAPDLVIVSAQRRRRRAAGDASHVTRHSRPGCRGAHGWRHIRGAHHAAGRREDAVADIHSQAGRAGAHVPLNCNGAAQRRGCQGLCARHAGARHVRHGAPSAAALRACARADARP